MTLDAKPRRPIIPLVCPDEIQEGFSQKCWLKVGSSFEAENTSVEQLIWFEVVEHSGHFVTPGDDRKMWWHNHNLVGPVYKQHRDLNPCQQHLSYSSGLPSEHCLWQMFCNLFYPYWYGLYHLKILKIETSMTYFHWGQIWPCRFPSKKNCYAKQSHATTAPGAPRWPPFQVLYWSYVA